MLYFDTKACIEGTSERPAMPTKVTLGLAEAAWLTAGAPALLNGHHDAQKNIITGLPVRLAPLYGAPDNVVPVNCSRSSAPATGAPAMLNTRAASKPITNHLLHDRFSRATILPPCALHGAC